MKRLRQRTPLGGTGPNPAISHFNHTDVSQTPKPRGGALDAPEAEQESEVNAETPAIMKAEYMGYRTPIGEAQVH